MENEILDLFINLDAQDHLLEYPVLYASGKLGWAVKDLDLDPRTDMVPLLQTILDVVPKPRIIDDDVECSFLKCAMPAGG